MAASIAGCLLAKRFDYLRAHLFDIELPRLVAQLGAFVLMFLPFFAAYGLCEYLGYQVGRRHLGGRMRPVYALALFGAATAYLCLRLCLPHLGMARILGLSFVALALAIAVLGDRPSRKVATSLAALLLAGSCLPGLEPAFLSLYKGHGAQSTWDYATNRGCTSVFQQWGRYSLCEILAGPDRRVYYGFYNDMFQWEYSPRRGLSGPSLGAVPIMLTEPGQRLAIIGSGGGRQVAWPSVSAAAPWSPSSLSQPSSRPCAALKIYSKNSAGFMRSKGSLPSGPRLAVTSSEHATLSTSSICPASAVTPR